jgi:hypothetical protein
MSVSYNVTYVRTYNIYYITLLLNYVCRNILKEGKYKGQTGDHFNYLPLEEKHKYVLQDPQLAMKLSKQDNYKILDMILAISKLCELNFCRQTKADHYENLDTKS